MTVKDLINSGEFTVINKGEKLDREITVPFCCDLLSIAMGKMPAGAAWVTVMGNINTLAVATLADAACIILAEDCKLDEPSKLKAKEQGITILYSEYPIFHTALMIYKKLHD